VIPKGRKWSLNKKLFGSKPLFGVSQPLFGVETLQKSENSKTKKVCQEIVMRINKVEFSRFAMNKNHLLMEI
jgi:hypothetical protein